MMEKRNLVIFVAFLAGVFAFCEGWGSSDKVLLSNVKAVTLQQGRMTNGRRSAPVPQLSCVGGAARHKFQPQTVQCINMGSDGHDMQWECKADMDNAYRFGQIQVSCEGYDYPDDPYVLKGSCGLEYTIEFTEEGLRRESGSGSSYNYNTYQSGNTTKGGDWGLVKYLGVLVVMFVIYKTCIKPNQQQPGAPGQPGPGGPAQGSSQPPPYGFRPEFSPPDGPPPSYEQSQGPSSAAYDHSFTQGNPAYDRASAPPPDPDCGSNTRQARDNSGPGFWSGAATGAGLGYLFGNRNRGGNNGGWGRGWGSSSHNTQHHHHHHHHANPSSTNHSSGWFSSSSNSGNNGGGGGSSSSGSRTASGFGGTSRR